MLKKAILVVLIFIPISCWAFVKPIRILAPSFNGVSCITDQVCVEDETMSSDAIALYDEALLFVNNSIGNIKKPPQIIFCTTEACFNSFGFSLPSKAVNIGAYGVVVGPKGWKNYIVRHELIHHLQAERLGVLKQWNSDMWFKEGMAYSLSQDPRELSGKRLEYRTRFDAWHAKIDKNHFWQKAKAL